MNRKGISSVVGAVLLITISVGASASAFVFIKEIQSSMIDSTEDRLSEREMERKSSLNIESGYNSTDGFISLSIRNTGSRSLIAKQDGNKLWSFYIDGVPLRPRKSWTFIDPNKNADLTVSIDPQESVLVNTTTTFPAPDTSKLIRVTGRYGTSDSINCFNSGRSSC